MLIDRGYEVTPDDLEAPYEPSGPKGESTKLYTHGATQQRMYLIFYPVKGKSLSAVKDNIVALTKKLSSASNVKYFLVVTNATQNLERNLQEKLPYTIDVFNINFFATNPLDHALAPKYELTTNPNPARIKPSELPPIAIDNPVIRYYGWEAGQIVLVTRDVSPYVKGNIKQTYYWRQIRDMTEATIIQSAAEDEEADDIAAEGEGEAEAIEAEVDEPVEIDEATATEA